MKDQIFKPKLLLLGLLSLSALGQSSKEQQEGINRYLVGSQLYDDSAYEVSENILDYHKTASPISKLNQEFKLINSKLKNNHPTAEMEMTSFLEKQLTGLYYDQGVQALGNYYFKNGEYTQAVNFYEKASGLNLEIRQQQVLALKQVFSYILQKDYVKAEALLKRLKTYEFFTAEKAYYYGYLAYMKENYNEAERYLNESGMKNISYILLDIEFRAGAFDKAISRGQTLYPKSRGIQKKNIAKILGESYFNLGDYQTAAPYLESYKGPGAKVDQSHYYMLGYTYYKSGSYTKALDQFNKITEGSDQIAQNAYYHLGEVYLKLDKKSEALNAFRNTSQSNFSEEITQDAYYNYAKLSYEIGNPYEPTTEVISSFLKKYPSSAHWTQMNTLMIQAFIGEKNYDGGIQYIQRAGIEKNKEVYGEILALKGMELFNQRKFKEALNYLDQASKSKANASIRAKSYFWAGESAYLIENYRASYERYKKFNALKNHSATYEQNLINYNLGYAGFKLEKYQEAISNFEKFIGTSPGNADRKIDAHLRIADAYFVQQDYWKAMQSYNKVLAAKKQDQDYAYYQKSLCYGLVGKKDTKISSLTEFDKKFPRSKYRDDAYFELGSALANAKQNAKAAKNFQKLIATFPNSIYASRALLKEGLIYYNEGKNQEALSVFKFLASNYKDSEEASQAIKNVEQVYIDLGQVENYAKWVKSLGYISYSDDDLARGMYISAEQKYLEQKPQQSSELFKKYLDKYPEGSKKIAANYYLAQSLYQLEKFEESKAYFKEVLAEKSNSFRLKSAEKLALIYLEDGDWNSALPVLETIENLASSKILDEFAQSNIMKAYLSLEEYGKAASYAEKVLASKPENKNLVDEAKYAKARGAVLKKQYGQAAKTFTEIEPKLKGEAKAIALYYIALQKNLNKNYAASNESLQKLIKQSSNYPYWGAKGLLTMSSNFEALDDPFQATYILESVIKNYERFPDLHKRAQQQLDKLKAKANNEKN